MKRKKLLISALALVGITANAQKVTYEEYDLDNGLHVILHQDNTAPVVITSVMYHVGAKNESPEKTGFAHFFEHLLFEGTQHIERGKWFEIVASNGGTNNANTTKDRTYYYEVFPSNNLELGLWLESERLMHPIINQIGIDTQKEVVQEEKRRNYDNAPYGRWREVMSKNLFKNHPYRWETIGSLEHLASATLDDFKNFNTTYYVPNNAVLIVAGDIDFIKTKKMINDYFASIPKGKDIVRTTFIETPITTTIRAEYSDSNIQIPLILLGYRTPEQTNREAYVLDMVASLLSDGKSSRLYKKIVDEKKIALQVFAFNSAQEDYGTYILGGIPVGKNSLEAIKAEIDAEIIRIQTELISEMEFKKLQNKLENNFVNSNSSIEGVANSLATYYMLYNNTALIKEEIAIYRSITREEIRNIARKYLNPNQRVELNYLPEEKTTD